MSERKWTDAQIRCAINYAMDSMMPWHYLWPSPRYRMQERVMKWLNTFTDDAIEYANSGAIEEEMKAREALKDGGET